MVKSKNEYKKDLSSAAAAMGRKGGKAKSERKAKSSAANGRMGGRPKSKTWHWRTNFITAKITHKGLILENWTCNQGAVSGRKILIKGEKEMPTDATIQLYSEILKHGDADNIVVIRTGIKVQ